MDNQDLQFIQKQIDYQFKNPDLLQQAFVRRSYAKEQGGEDNEILEFIGDKVLDFIVVKLLAEEYGYMLSECNDFNAREEFNEFACEYSEGKLTEIKKHLVERKMLAHRVDVLDISDYLILGKGDKRNHVNDQDSVREDLFEAIVGAVALDSNWDLAQIQSTVEIMLDFDSSIAVDDINFVEAIQEWSLDNCGDLPDFQSGEMKYISIPLMGQREVFSKAFWNRNRNPWNGGFFCRLAIKNAAVDKAFYGWGESKNKARKDVCELAYQYLDENDLLFTIRNEIENPNRNDAISQLEILARRGYFSLPTYDFSQSYDRNGNPLWNAECHIEEVEYYFSAAASSKKDAKKSAAYDMLLYVLGNETGEENM